MIELGKKQILTVKRIKTFGVYLGCDGEDQAVLLPAKYVPEGRGIGDERFLYIVIPRTDWWQQHWSRN